MTTGTKSKLDITLNGNTLSWTNRTSGKVYATFDVTVIPAALHDTVYAYGVKQILSDSYVKHAAGTTGWFAAFDQRAVALKNGTWGQRVARLVDVDVWQAMLALGLARDSDANRERWSAMRPAERAALRVEPRVTEYLAAHAGDVPDTADLMARFN